MFYIYVYIPNDTLLWMKYNLYMCIFFSLFDNYDKYCFPISSHIVKKLKAGKKYYFRVYANTFTAFTFSEEVMFVVPVQNKEKVCCKW